MFCGQISILERPLACVGAGIDVAVILAMAEASLLNGPEPSPSPNLKKSENPLLVLLQPKQQWEIITFHRPLIHSQAPAPRLISSASVT